MHLSCVSRKKNSPYLKLKMFYVHCVVCLMHLWDLCLCWEWKLVNSFKPENKDYCTVCLNEKSLWLWQTKTEKETACVVSYLPLRYFKSTYFKSTNTLNFEIIPLFITQSSCTGQSSQTLKITPTPFFLLVIFYRNWKDHTDVIKFFVSLIFSCPLTLTQNRAAAAPSPCWCVYQVVFP